jgi:hypothetical protein
MMDGVESTPSQIDHLHQDWEKILMSGTEYRLERDEDGG